MDGTRSSPRPTSPKSSVVQEQQHNNQQQQHNKSKQMGVTKEVIQEGNGVKPNKGASVTVHCTGYGKGRDLSQKFWSTKDAGQQPFTFSVGLGQVIRGWDETVIDMSVGEIVKIKCSADYAYGASGFPDWGIMPNSDLIFEIEVLSIQ